MIWTEERGLKVVPFGIDLSERLIELARERLPDDTTNFAFGNGWDWVPPRTFDDVRIELVHVPDKLGQRYVARILDRYLCSGSWLLAAEYRSRDNETPVLTIDQELTRMGFAAENVRAGIWEGIEETRVTVIQRPVQHESFPDAVGPPNTGYRESWVRGGGIPSGVTREDARADAGRRSG